MFQINKKNGLSSWNNFVYCDIHRPWIIWGIQAEVRDFTKPDDFSLWTPQLQWIFQTLFMLPQSS